MTDTLRSICEQCTHLNDPQLDFIPQELQQHREIIRRDLNELVLAARAELEKSVVVVAGSLMEAVLFGFLKGQESYISACRGESFVVQADGSLQDFINIFSRYFADQFPTGLVGDIHVRYRDLVHVNREVLSNPGVCAEASRAMLRTLDTLIGQLTAAGGP